jgi:hypothetical protein
MSKAKTTFGQTKHLVEALVRDTPHAGSIARKTMRERV